jgi:hypothetical protein
VSFWQLRTVLALCLLFTSTLQSFVAQAHIHVPPHSAPGSAALSFDGPLQPSNLPGDSDEPSKRTRGDNSSTCPLCQALAFSGAPLSHSAHAIECRSLPSPRSRTAGRDADLRSSNPKIFAG